MTWEGETKSKRDWWMDGWLMVDGGMDGEVQYSEAGMMVFWRG